METIEIDSTRAAAECIEPRFGARELRDLASNAGVSRERGDSKMATAVKLAEQNPALVAEMLENDPEIDMDATEFREKREVGEEKISLDEAMIRARSDKMEDRLHQLKVVLAGLPSYEAEIKWEYGGDVRDGSSSVSSKKGYEPGITSVRVKVRDDVNMHWALKGSAHILLSPRGRCSLFDVAHGSYEKAFFSGRNEPEPRKSWRRAKSMMDTMYDG